MDRTTIKTSDTIEIEHFSCEGPKYLVHDDDNGDNRTWRHIGKDMCQFGVVRL